MEFEIKKCNTIYIGIINMEYFDISLSKYIQYLYEENCKTVVKEIKIQINEEICHVYR